MDVGGSHVSACLMECGGAAPVDGSLVRLSADPEGAADEILGQWCNAARGSLSYLGDRRLLGIGVAMPGPFDYPGGISLIQGVGKFDKLRGANIRVMFKDGLGMPSVAVVFRNDAQCFLLGEAWHGAATGCTDAIGITLGTGFGSAFMRGGRCVEAGRGVPPETWFYRVAFGGGIADDAFSTRGMLRLHLARGGACAADVRELAARAAKEEIARDTFVEFGDLLGGFLGPFVRDFAPQALVVGGNIARAWELFGPALVARVAEADPGARVVPSELMEDAALIGAARLPLMEKEPEA